MDIDNYVKGLVHFVRHNDDMYGDDEVKRIIHDKYSEVISIAVTSNQGLLLHNGEGKRRLRLIDMIETVEDLLRARNTCLIEVEIGKIKHEETLAAVFFMIDAVQRICLHYRARDEDLKLFFVG